MTFIELGEQEPGLVELVSVLHDINGERPRAVRRPRICQGALGETIDALACRRLLKREQGTDGGHSATVRYGYSPHSRRSIPIFPDGILLHPEHRLRADLDQRHAQLRGGRDAKTVAGTVLESCASASASGGGLQGCPLRGVRPRRWRCGCRARTARRSRRRWRVCESTTPATGRPRGRPPPWRRTGRRRSTRRPRRAGCSLTSRLRREHATANGSGQPVSPPRVDRLGTRPAGGLGGPIRGGLPAHARRRRGAPSPSSARRRVSRHPCARPRRCPSPPPRWFGV